MPSRRIASIRQACQRFQDWKSPTLSQTAGFRGRRWRKRCLSRFFRPPQGRVELCAVPETRFLNPMGIVHGGWAMTMLDSAMGLSALTTLKPGEICPSP